MSIMTVSFCNDNTEEVSALIVAGGKAERMSGKEKGLQCFRGVPMVVSVAMALKEVTSMVAVNANRYQEDYESLGFEVIADLADYQDVGPLSGVMAGLHNAKSQFLLLSPCDSPCVSSDAFHALLDAIKREPDKIHYIVTASGRHPLHAVLPVSTALSALSTFLARDMKKSVMAFYELHGCRALHWSEEAELINVNYSEQLE
ncbi:molybdenum cofactor guanylyltransferase [Marinomonas spartinae]|uniref:molybdenum cofactor guanylyltransferase n=1 Tax=Marinomonas spartinae TaxID=1792290 RepID=UPI001FE009BB|nr:molybdenum cofactor guanylyltransferase [Marinomonas spartinae]